MRLLSCRFLPGMQHIVFGVFRRSIDLCQQQVPGPEARFRSDADILQVRFVDSLYGTDVFFEC